MNRSEAIKRIDRAIGGGRRLLEEIGGNDKPRYQYHQSGRCTHKHHIAYYPYSLWLPCL